VKNPETGKIRLAAMPLREIDRRASSRDSRRNAIGSVPADQADEFVQAVAERLRALGVPCDAYVKRIGRTESRRIELLPCPLAEEIRALDPKRRPEPIGIFLEPLEGTESLGVWIYFTVRRRALTRFRRFCLDHLFDVESADQERLKRRRNPYDAG